MGKKIRNRTPAEQIIHDRIIDKLMSGESAVHLAEEFGLKAGTLRGWKASRRKRDARELSTVSNTLTQFCELKAQQSLDKSRATLQVDNASQKIVVSDSNALPTASPQQQEPSNVSLAVQRERNDDLGDGLKTLLLEQANVPRALLASLRAKVGGTLEDIDAAFRISIHRIRGVLEQGVVDPDTGEVETLSISEFKMVTAMLRDLTKSYADLHMLPHGILKTAPFKFSDAVPPQHLHLHSHGRRNQPKAIDVITTEVTETSNPAPSAIDVMDAGQADLVCEL